MGQYRPREDLTEYQMRLTIWSFLIDLSNIDVDDLTTFELRLLRAFAKNPPNKREGIDYEMEK